MDRLEDVRQIGDMLDIHTNASPTRGLVIDAMKRRSFCTLATVSDAGRPHAAGVLYEMVGTDLWVNTIDSSRKARNVAANPHVAVMVPVRRMPVGAPPSAVQFQATARLVPVDDPEVTALLAEGALKSITSHGELDAPGSVFIHITPGRVAHTYGLGLPLLKLATDPLHAGGRVELA